MQHPAAINVDPNPEVHRAADQDDIAVGWLLYRFPILILGVAVHKADQAANIVIVRDRYGRHLDAEMGGLDLAHERHAILIALLPGHADVVGKLAHATSAGNSSGLYARVGNFRFIRFGKPAVAVT